MNDLRFAFVGLLASTPLFGQSQLQARRVPGPARDAGTYHVATGTWTRGSRQAAVGPDAIYRNDAPSGYFGTGWEGCWTMEEFMVPGPTSPLVGPQDAYLIDGFSFSYCADGPGTVDWTWGFWDSYVACDDPTSPAACMNELSLGYVLAGLPGGPACWTVTIDLSGGYEFCLEADGGVCAPGYDGGGLGLDGAGLGFGWVSTGGIVAGPILAGDPTWIPAGDGTCYRPGYTSACGVSVATGLGRQDLMSITNYDYGGAGIFTGCTLANGCYFFGGYINNNGCGAPANVPISQFDFRLYTDCTVACDCIGPLGCTTNEYCDEATNPNNAADISVETNDASAPSILVSLANAPPGQFCYLLVGNGNQVVSHPPGSKGDLCVVGGSCLGRFDLDIGPVAANGTFATDVQNPLSNPCQGAFQITPGSTWYFQYWHRQPMGQPSTFSSAIGVSFL